MRQCLETLSGTRGVAKLRALLDRHAFTETDGLRYRRTAEQQARAHVRDQAHLASGLQPLRFTHAQVIHDRTYVEATLRRTAARLRPR